jgi:uncharacterized protein YqeY
MVFMLREKINDGVKDAMKSQDKLRLSTLRLVNAAIKNADIEARGLGKDAPDDPALLALMQKMIKQREESVSLYEKGGRKELADQERGEIAVIQTFLPQQMSEEEMKAAVKAVINDTGAASMKDMGKVIGSLRAKYAGQMDFGKASALVKSALAGNG